MHVLDSKVSLKAKGVCEIIRLIADANDNCMTLKDISQFCTDGLTSIRTAVAELEKNGYLTRIRTVDEENGGTKMLYILNERENSNG